MARGEGGATYWRKKLNILRLEAAFCTNPHLCLNLDRSARRMLKHCYKFCRLERNNPTLGRDRIFDGSERHALHKRVLIILLKIAYAAVSTKTHHNNVKYLSFRPFLRMSTDRYHIPGEIKFKDMRGEARPDTPKTSGLHVNPPPLAYYRGDISIVSMN